MRFCATMDLDPLQLFRVLKANLDNKEGPKICYQQLSNLNDFLTQEQVYLRDLDLFLQHFFHKSQGFSDFIAKVVNKREFKSSVIRVFEIIYTLINNFSSNLEKYVEEICNVCFKVIKSTLVTSDEKVKSLEVLILILEKIDKSTDIPQYYTGIYGNLVESISKKKCDSVEEKIFIALGSFAKNFQYLIADSEHLRNIFLKALEAQMCQKEFSNRALCGIFTGLDYYCESFRFDYSSKEDQVIIGKLYKYIDKVAIPKATVKIGNRAAIRFLANNMAAFITLIVERFQHWHETLLNWLKLGSDDHKVGVLAVEAFYRVLGDLLLNEASLKYTHVTTHFYKYLKETLIDDDVSNRERRLCLQGLSSFSGAFHLHLSDDDLKDLLRILTQNLEQSFVLSREPSPDLLEYLPFYIHTVAKFVVFRHVSSSEFFCLQKSAVTMIKAFPELPYACHGAAVEALVTTFYFLLDKDEKLCDSFVENVVYQGVVWTCSHRHTLESDIEGNPQIVTVKNYLDLWRSLLHILPMRKFDKYGIFLHDRKFILVKITDKLIRSMLILVNKLNVSLKSSNSIDPTTDIESAYRVEESNDFGIFLNLVDFYQKIFEEFDPFLLRKCICKLIQHFVAKCTKYPLISGFYKLLTCCLRAANKINDFLESVDTTQDINLCLSTLLKFLKVLLNRIQQCKGDLLVACLQVLLEYPVVIVRKMLLACVPAFKIIFQVGRTYVKLTYQALSTLECWQRRISWDEMDTFLIQIVPLLDCYLQSRSLGDLTGSSTIENRRKTARALKKRRVLVDSEPELTSLQIKVLTFVGQQRDKVCEAFASCEDNISLSVTGSQQHLKITLPYEDMTLDFYLDKLIPRIAYVALNSTDRKTRVMACEVLQAAVVIFLGKTKQMTHSGLSDLNQLLAHIATPLLQLGCDMDPVVEQLFQPLCFQLIHWYTHISQLRGEHGAIIMEAVLEGITHPNDTALRDFCGKCVNEYVKWTIKQSNEKKLAKDPINIKILLKKMRFYGTHPDNFKKLGAALIFNNIYGEIREETSLLSMFWMEFLHVFVTSLATYEDEPQNDVSLEQISSALVRIERGFVEKADLFNGGDKERRIPLGMGGSLKDAAVWLLGQTGSESSCCRSKCFEMFCAITPHTVGFKNVGDFVRRFCENTKWIEKTYEGFLVEYPTMESLQESNDVGPIQWMRRFLCALDGYIFVVQQELGNALSDTMRRAVGHFIDSISDISLDGAFAVVQAKEWIFTDFEKTTFDKQRSQAVLRIFRLFNLLQQQDLSVYFHRSFWNFAANVLFDQRMLGFENFALYTDNSEVTNLLGDFIKKLPNNAVNELLQVLDEYLTHHFIGDFDIKSNISLKQRSLINGLNILQSFSLKQFVFYKYKNGLTRLLLEKFLVDPEGDRIYVNNMQDTTLTFCLSILDFSLTDDNEFKTFVDYLYKPFGVQSADTRETIPFGSYIINLFEDSVIEKLVTNFEIFLKLSLEKCQMGNLVEFVTLIATYSISKKQLKREAEVVVKVILRQWEVFEKYFVETDNNIESGLDFVKNLLPLMKFHRINASSLKNWLIGLLQLERDLKLKRELDLKVEVFYLLVEILDVADGGDTGLRQILRNVRSKLLLDASSVPFETKTVFLEKLLSVIPKIKTPALLVFLLEIYAKDFAKITAFDLNVLLKNFILTDQEIQRKSLLALYDLYTSSELSSEEKYRIITETTAVFQFCSLSVFEEFFVSKITEIISVLKKPFNADTFAAKILSFILVEVLFSRCTIRGTDTEISRVTRAAVPEAASNKALILLILECALSAIKDSQDSPDLEEARRLYKCHSYNATVSIVSNSLRNESFYKKLFIRQDDNNSDILWNSLVDTNRVYSFQTDFESIPKRRKIIVNIRNEMRANKKSGQLHSVRYIESMRVYNSSLSEDLTRFDFTKNVVRSQSMEDQTGDKAQITSEIELDGTDINSHECMATVCGLIEHIIHDGITELPAEDQNDYVLPAWLCGIRGLLLNSETHVNVKIFWMKVIDNTVHIFKHFAKWFLEPVLKFLVDGCAGTRINYFLTDMVGILATLSTTAVPTSESETSLCSELIQFLINNLNNERQDMFKYHLDLIRLLVEAWKESTRFPYELVSSKLNVDPTSRKVEVGVHVSSIFLANRIPPRTDDLADFCKALFNIAMKGQHITIYRPCAETIGLLLSSASREAMFPKIVANVHVMLKKINDREKFAHVLEGIVLRYPQIADEHHLRGLLSRIDGVSKQLKVIYLKIFLSRCGLVETLTEFKAERWDSYINHDSLEVQLLTLELIHKCLGTLEQSSLFKCIVESICKQVTNSSVLCRTKVFDIVMLVYQKQYPSEDILNSCKKVLTLGLVDNDGEIRDKVYNFWKSSSRLSVKLSERFAYILTNLYEKNTENEFLGYSCYLLLDSVKSNEEHGKTLFEHPLEDCDFQDYHLQINWRARHASMAPLFIETVRSATEDYQMSYTDKLRATRVSREFTPTQNDRAQQFSQVTVSESSLYVGSQTDPEFVNPNLVSISGKYRIPKRRFLRDKSKILGHFAQREIKRSLQKVEDRRDKAKERENRVVIYRSYRKGDLPDIQITLQAVLEPLQALALRDGEISRCLYSEVFQGLWSSGKSDRTFIDQIAVGVETIFNNSIHFNRNLFRTLFDVLLLCKAALTIPTELVVSVSQSSGLRALGALLLEEYLMTGDDGPPDSKRMRGAQSDTRTTLWIKLAELYKGMNEWDIVRSILLHKIECSPHVTNAILTESNNQWKDAQDLYKISIETEDNSEIKDFCYESYFKCFAYLGEWGSLVKSVDSVVPHAGNNCWDNLWDEGFGQHKLMPWYISGHLKDSLFSQVLSNQFLTDLNCSLNSDRLDYLETNFCEELTMLWIVQKEINEAQKYVKMYLSNFLSLWQQLDFLYISARYHQLLKLHNVIDVYKFVVAVDDFNLHSKTKIQDLIDYWKVTSCEKLPLLFNEERVLYRRQFVKLLKGKIENDEELMDLLPELKEVEMKLSEGLMETALNQNNFYMTKKYLNDFSKQSTLKFKLFLSKLAHIKSATETNPEKKFDILVKGCEALDQIFLESGQPFLKVVASITLFRHLEQISTILSDNEELFQNKKLQMSSVIRTKSLFSSSQIASFAVDKLKSSLRVYETETENDIETDDLKRTTEHVTIADAYVRMAKFVKNKGRNGFNDYIVFVLKAMKFNSSEGRQLFPCIIMAERFTNEEKESFLKEAENVPVWMFLGWLPQILASIDSPKVSSLAPLVLRIAKTYPQAVMYAYRLSKENYRLGCEESRILVERLDELLLADDNVNKFLKALSFVGVPANILSYYVQKMIKVSQSNELSELRTIHEHVLNEVFARKPQTRDSHPLQGVTFRSISKFEKELKTCGEYINRTDKTPEIISLLRRINTELRNMLKDGKKNSLLLKDYSPWLANFSAHKLNFDMEIPGQYDGNKMPLPQHHVKISGFYPNIDIMPSLRKPVKITIMGNNTKQYPFLVKFGEDVRQDQRIQQLLSLMNKIFEADVNLRGQKFSILTYQVIPLTTSLGMIQWIENTRSLQASMVDAKSSSFKRVSENYRKWIYRNKNQSEMDAYGTAAIHYSREKTVLKFRSLVSCIEWDILKSFFLKLGANVESFFVLRNNFIVSYAVICISHWILGVGDRHLSNSLISSRTGKVLGIDFGHAFGTATQLLPVPELVPFRLTPHITNFMEPMGEKCLFREVMVNCLRSLKSNCCSLLSTMKVFIEEPSLDWLERSARFGGGVTPSGAAWYPAQKINQAERKLSGVNPKSVVIEDLRTGCLRNEAYIDAYVTLVEGRPESNLRAAKDATGLSAEDQVDCLIDQATDYNLLGRMYEGWTPWM